MSLALITAVLNPHDCARLLKCLVTCKCLNCYGSDSSNDEENQCPITTWNFKIKPRMLQANVASRAENNPPGQTAQDSAEGHAEINSPSNAMAPERGGQLPAMIMPNESPDGAIKTPADHEQVDNDDDGATTVIDTC